MGQLYEPPQAAITRYCGLGAPHDRSWFSHSPEGWKSKTRVLAELVSGSSPLPGWLTATFSVCPHTTSSPGVGRESDLWHLFLEEH